MDLKKIIAGAALTVAALTSTAASALSINFDVNGGWLDDSYLHSAGIGGVTFHNEDADLRDTFHTIQWGSGSTYSALQIDNKMGQLVANGEKVLLSTLTHFNRPIDINAQRLTFAQLQSQIVLSGLADSSVFDVTFKETPNVAPCVDANPNGSICDDFFRLLGKLPSVDFVINGATYHLEVFLEAGANVVIQYDANGDAVYYTSEGKTSVLNTYGRLTAVPEPTSLALLGLGMLGFAAVRRRMI